MKKHIGKVKYILIPFILNLVSFSCIKNTLSNIIDFKQNVGFLVSIYILFLTNLVSSLIVLNQCQLRKEKEKAEGEQKE